MGNTNKRDFRIIRGLKEDLEKSEKILTSLLETDREV